jgi:hypothetical protein
VPAGLAAVAPALTAALARGARVVSNIFSVKGAEAWLLEKATTSSGLAVYLYGGGRGEGAAGVAP